ncbi:MAG: tRNA pseudouridine(38-40) synthase TruA [Terracidiphilus sp.]
MADSSSFAADLHTWKVTLAYDGTDFCGWQIQPGERTIQGELQDALGRVTGETPLPQGSGRTDAGVHAQAQVASFTLRAPIPAANLQRALNRTLPESIRIIDANTVPNTFHARHSAVAKTYEYRIWVADSACSPVCSPFLARYVYAYPWPLDLIELESSAKHFVGEHDFLSFMATDSDLTTRNASKLDERNADPREAHSTIRTIFSSNWKRQATEEGDLLIYRVRGNGFLHHMVRNLVGTMLDVGRGYLKSEAVPAIFAARSRSAAGPTAPARGLFLHSVEYEEDESTFSSRRAGDSGRTD